MLRLLQLVSPALPVGAYTYSEGLETLVQTETVLNSTDLMNWLIQELRFGAIRIEGAVFVRLYQAVETNDRPQLQYWNHWLSAFRETEELRQQSWQMGRSLHRLLSDLSPDLPSLLPDAERCHFATAFAIAAAHWQIDCETAVLGYLQSWAANLVNAGVRLVPLGQTQGQQLLLQLYPQIEQTASDVMHLPDEQLHGCGWGLSIASMQHETLYSRLFRS